VVISEVVKQEKLTTKRIIKENTKK
jgi:hypothetical protein